MDTSQNNQQPTTNNARPPSSHSTASTTLAVKPDPAKDQPETEFHPKRYGYIDKVGAGNPDAKPKEKSKLGKLMSKFQNPVVKQSLAACEREKLEQERTGVRKN
ncbi:hypothetical protein N658DRAFT_501095 [Parathielavia hyrcaniae]|uniref:Uncharacterized protein n=1 Tax=Parathielavia hyrcaniae TaxID=113614 RepID=A0AAN6PRX9_9PEZI|nr:hypothetical protein N658DRAFT_501095 [Parathielavia hyrcaniae]